MLGHDPQFDALTGLLRNPAREILVQAETWERLLHIVVGESDSCFSAGHATSSSALLFVLHIMLVLLQGLCLPNKFFWSSHRPAEPGLSVCHPQAGRKKRRVVNRAGAAGTRQSISCRCIMKTSQPEGRLLAFGLRGVPHSASLLCPRRTLLPLILVTATALMSPLLSHSVGDNHPSRLAHGDNPDRSWTDARRPQRSGQHSAGSAFGYDWYKVL